MTWHRYPLNTYQTEAKPLDAAVERRLVRGNLLHLAGQSPATGSPWVANGTRSTGSTSYDDASTLWRSHVRHVRSALGSVLRALQCRAELYMSAGTATVRLCASRTWVIPEDPPQAGVQEVESAAGAITSVSAATPTEVTLNLSRLVQSLLTTFGAGGAQRGSAIYDSTWLTLQAKVNAGPNICYLRNLAWQEVDPS